MAEQSELISMQPDLEERRRILAFIMAAGKLLLENGAEVFRVEQTMKHMSNGYHLREFDVYVVANGIFASAGAAELSEIRNVSTRGVHLGRVAAINELSRNITAGRLSIAQAEIALVEVQDMPLPSAKTRVLASAFGAFGFCFLFGGSVLDAAVSLLAGALLGGYLYWAEKSKVSALFQRLSGAAMVAVVCIACGLLCRVLSIDISAAIIGALMILTPGVSFTMAIRDFVHSDYLAGTIRLIDALLVASSIAIGVGLTLWLETVLLGGVV